MDFTIFTTRADTIFGVTFMVLAPKSELVDQLTTDAQKQEVDDYLAYVKKRTELDRMANHTVTGVFTGSYAINPFTGDSIPVWISGIRARRIRHREPSWQCRHTTRATMPSPSTSASPIVPLIEGADVSEESFDAKGRHRMQLAGSRKGDSRRLLAQRTHRERGHSQDQGVRHGKGMGRVKVNYRLRDAIFSRQRY